MKAIKFYGANEHLLVALRIKGKFIKAVKKQETSKINPLLKNAVEMSKVTSWEDFIGSSFLWEEAEEGHEYWAKISMFENIAYIILAWMDKDYINIIQKNKLWKKFILEIANSISIHARTHGQGRLMMATPIPWREASLTGERVKNANWKESIINSISLGGKVKVPEFWQKLANKYDF